MERVRVFFGGHETRSRPSRGRRSDLEVARSRRERTSGGWSLSSPFVTRSARSRRRCSRRSACCSPARSRTSSYPSRRVSARRVPDRTWSPPQLPGASPETMAAAMAAPARRATLRTHRRSDRHDESTQSSLGQTNITMQFDLDRSVRCCGSRRAEPRSRPPPADLSVRPADAPDTAPYRSVRHADLDHRDAQPGGLDPADVRARRCAGSRRRAVKLARASGPVTVMAAARSRPCASKVNPAVLQSSGTSAWTELRTIILERDAAASACRTDLRRRDCASTSIRPTLAFFLGTENYANLGRGHDAGGRAPAARRRDGY